MVYPLLIAYIVPGPNTCPYPVNNEIRWGTGFRKAVNSLGGAGLKGLFLLQMLTLYFIKNC